MIEKYIPEEIIIIFGISVAILGFKLWWHLRKQRLKAEN